VTTDVQTAVDVADAEMDADWITPVCGSSFSFAAAVAGVVMVVVDVVMAVAMTAVCGSSFFFAAAADGAIMDSDAADAAVAVMAATVADADICSFFHVTVHTMCDQQRISPS